jgi:hypothetical protein
MRKKGIITRVLMRRLNTCARQDDCIYLYDIQNVVKSFVNDRKPKEIRKARVAEIDAHIMEDDIFHIFLGNGDDQFFQVKV